jgi:hypothetical protein
MDEGVNFSIGNLNIQQCRELEYILSKLDFKEFNTIKYVQ